MKKIIIIGILLNSFLIIETSTLSQNQISPTNNHPNKIENKADNYYKYPYSFGAIKIVPNTNPSQEAKRNETTNKDCDTNTNFWIMVATIVIAISAICQVLAMIFQYYAMKRQIDKLQDSVNIMNETFKFEQENSFYIRGRMGESNRISKISADAAKRAAETLPRIERAYVFAEVVSPVGTNEIQPEYDNHGATDRSILTVDIFLLNHGKTPAIITKINIVLGTHDPKLLKPEEQDIPFAGRVLGNEGRDKWYRIAVTYTATNKEMKDIRLGNPILFCYGIIEYEDIFKNPQRHTFCWEYRPLRNVGGKSWTISIDYKELNYNT